MSEVPVEEVGLEQPQRAEPGRRPGLNAKRTHSQPGSARRSGPRQPAPTSSIQTYHPSPVQENLQNTPNSYGGFRAHPSQFQSNVSPHDQGGNFGGPYTLLPNSSMPMGHTPSSHIARNYPHGAHAPPESALVSRSTPPGFSQMMSMQPRFSYQRPSPDRASPSQTFPNYSQPQMAPFTSSSSSTSAGPPTHSNSFMQPGQYQPIPYSASPPFTPYPSQPFVSGPSLYQPQYISTPYPHTYVPSGDPEGHGPWWYMPPGSAPQMLQYDPAHSSYPNYTMGYSRTEPPYTVDGPSHSSSTPLAGYPGQHQTGGTTPPTAPSTSSAPPARNSSQSVQPVDLNTTAPAPSKVTDRIAIRKSYHPNPPAQRSEWVMWVGNVPSDTVHDELWRFFKQPPSQNSTRSGSPGKEDPSRESDELYDGVQSIFLISRSNCAFINFETESHLLKAIERFNGVPLRPNDTRCPRLVCRVRRKDDDLKAGVGGQRGVGIHMRWVKEREAKVDGAETSTPSAKTTEQLDQTLGSLSLSSDEDPSQVSQKQSSTGSYASTNSSILTMHFPKRYFILKSLTQFDLDLSVQKGLWATQKHNENILDQAYRTSTDVYLIFGVNKSGEFYGYARMAGPILQGGHAVPWASRTSDPNLPGHLSLSSTARGSRQPDGGSTPLRLTRRGDAPIFFSPVENRLVEESPGALSTPEIQAAKMEVAERLATAIEVESSDPRGLQSAPAVLGPAHRKFTTGTPKTKQSLGTDQYLGAVSLESSPPERMESFELDPTAPIRARRDTREADPLLSEPALLGPVAEEVNDEAPKVNDTVPMHEGWGASFPIEWLCTEHLPFFRTRHLRNPWNHDREIKVSRDGTELEPTIGQTLLDEWTKLAAEPEADDERIAPTRRGSGTPASTTALAAAESRPKGGGKRS